MRRNQIGTLIVLAALFASATHAYIRNTVAYSDGTIVPLKRTDNAGIQFYINSKIAPGLQSSATGSLVTVFTAGSDPVYAMQAAAATWTAVTTANVKFLPLKTTDKLIDPNDNQMTVAVGSTAADISAVGGALAITSIQTAAAVGGMDDTKGVIGDSDIIINPAGKFSTDRSTANDLQAVMTHEFGHALGMNHSGLLGAVMFQAAAFNARYLTADEVGFANAVYPGMGASPVGTINGKVLASDATPVQSALVTLMDTTAGTALSAFTGADGTYSIQGVPGNYIVYAEPMGAGSIVQPFSNIYLPAGTKVTTNFQVTMLGGFSSPTRVAVAAGNQTSVPDLTVTSGTSSLAWPYVGVGRAGGTGDYTIVSGALEVSSGRAVDLELIGGGVDGTIGVQAFGRGISVRPGTVKADPTQIGGLPGQTLTRVTVDLASVDAPSLVTLILTKGQNIFPVSGAFVLTPPTPTFASGGVVSAASGKYIGSVSPGGLSSIYDIPGSPNLGPAAFVPNAPNYDGYGKLPSTLAGLTVTFDGVAAPMFLAWGQQVNFQVPFEVAGKTSTKVVVNYLGSVSTAVTVPVVAAQPAFFMISATDPFAANADYAANPKVNSVSNPVARGSFITVYGTGVGQQTYSVPTGVGAPGPPAGFAGTYTCAFGGKTVNALFAGWTPTTVGLAQWTFSIPSDAATGAVSLTCTDTVSGASTQSATIYIK